MDRLAICVPTYDHPQVVEQIICYCAGYLKENGVDIYYYDSSTDDRTKQIIKDMNDKGFDNIYHIPVSSDLDYGQKIDLIFSGQGLEKDYDYIWPVKDRAIFNEYMVRLVMDRLSGGLEPDVVVTLMSEDIFAGYYIDIDSPVELYKLFGKQTTSLGTVIYNRNTILKDYIYGDSVKAPKYRRDFWHYDFLYKKMAEMPKVVISIISKKGAGSAESGAAQGSGWQKSIWEIWIEEWIQQNYDLPDIYSPYKLLVIKDTTSISEILGDRETFVKLYEDGLLTKEIYEKYADMWCFVTDVPTGEIEKIANGLAD